MSEHKATAYTEAVVTLLRDNNFTVEEKEPWFILSRPDAEAVLDSKIAPYIANTEDDWRHVRFRDFDLIRYGLEHNVSVFKMAMTLAFRCQPTLYTAAICRQGEFRPNIYLVLGTPNDRRCVTEPRTLIQSETLHLTYEGNRTPWNQKVKIGKDYVNGCPYVLSSDGLPEFLGWKVPDIENVCEREFPSRYTQNTSLLMPLNHQAVESFMLNEGKMFSDMVCDARDNVEHWRAYCSAAGEHDCLGN